MESWLSLTNAPSRAVVGLCENLSARDCVIAWRSRIMWNWLCLRRAHDCARHTHTHTREKTTGRCYSVWPWAERFLSLWSRKSFKGLVHPNYKKHFSLLPLKQTRIKSIQREYSQGYFLLQLQISTKCITYKQTCRSEQTTAREWSHLSHTLVLIRLYL